MSTESTENDKLPSCCISKTLIGTENGVPMYEYMFESGFSIIGPDPLPGVDRNAKAEPYWRGRKF